MYPFSTNEVCNSAACDCSHHCTNGYDRTKHGELKEKKKQKKQLFSLRESLKIYTKKKKLTIINLESFITSESDKFKSFLMAD